MADTVLVLTSTGSVGSKVVDELVQAGERVRAVTRNPEKQTSTAGVEWAKFDFRDPSTFGPALEGVDRVFLLVPAMELAPYELLLPFVEVATQDKNRKLVLMTAEGVEFDEENPYRRLERFLENSGNPFVVLRPNWFMDNFQTYWLPGILHAGVIAVPAADAKTSFIDARDIAASAAAVLRADQVDNQAFVLSGPESLTYAEAADILSEKSGREIRYAPIEDAAFIETLIGAGVEKAYAELLAALFGATRQGYFAQSSGDVEKLTGRPPRTLAQYAEDNASVWKEQ